MELGNKVFSGISRRSGAVLIVRVIGGFTPYEGKDGGYYRCTRTWAYPDGYAAMEKESEYDAEELGFEVEAGELVELNEWRGI